MQTDHHPNQDSNDVDDVREKVSVLRIGLAILAVVGFVAFGVLFLQSMGSRSWASAILAGVSGLSLLPWVSYRSAVRDCLTLTLSTTIGVFVGIGAIFAYLGMFHFDWFSDLFNDKGMGPIGMIVFMVAGFAMGWCATFHLLIRLSFPTSKSYSDFFTSCLNTTSAHHARK